MRQIRRSGLATLMVTGGALALSAGAAHADSGAQGAAVGSPGVGSGNTVQAPVHVPVNVCGNTVNIVGLLNPAFGNSCANQSGPAEGGYGDENDRGPTHKDLPGTPRGGDQGGGSHGGGSHSGGGGATAESVTAGSPGVLSGNGVQLPVAVPVNLSGNSVNLVGIGNPVFGNTSVNGPSTPPKPERPEEPTENPTPRPQTPVRNVPVPRGEAVPPAPAPQGESSGPSLAATGAETLGYAASASAALLLGGALLYRRARRAGAEADQA